MDSFDEGSISSKSNLSKETEMTISVSWMGGGQIKDPNVAWDMKSVFSAAAAFPGKVAKCPQKTWAILTKYEANRSFNVWKLGEAFSPLEYDAVASYTSELFDNYMEYKQLLKIVQDIMANPDNYTAQAAKSNYIPIKIKTLIATRAALRMEMSKIVQAVDVLAKDPKALSRSASTTTAIADETVRAIIEEALNGSKSSGPQQVVAIRDDTVANQQELVKAIDSTNQPTFDFKSMVSTSSSLKVTIGLLV